MFWETLKEVVESTNHDFGGLRVSFPWKHRFRRDFPTYVLVGERTQGSPVGTDVPFSYSNIMNVWDSPLVLWFRCMYLQTFTSTSLSSLVSLIGIYNPVSQTQWNSSTRLRTYQGNFPHHPFTSRIRRPVPSTKE